MDFPSLFHRAAIAFRLLVITLASNPATAEEDEAVLESADKSMFHLLNPTPLHLLRDLDTDGPGAVESPYTVDAGHLQLEMTWVSYTEDNDSFEGMSYRLEAWAVAPFLMKVGLLNQLEGQIVMEPYLEVNEQIEGSHVRRGGFGDTTLRFKYNVWGNDGGRTALAVMPYVTFPTSEEALGVLNYEGGLVLPFSMTLPGEFWMGLTSQLGVAQDEDASGYHPEFVNSAALGHDLFWNLFGYVEFLGAVSTERDAPWIGLMDTGLIFTLTENSQLNAGVSLGVTRAADDWNAFAGMAWRY